MQRLFRTNHMIGIVVDNAHDGDKVTPAQRAPPARRPRPPQPLGAAAA